jgi:predicted RNase H-like nuclease
VLATWTPGTVAVTVRTILDLGVVVDELASGRVTAVGIDMPIGLSDAQPRACDVEARSLLGPRRSSVFPAPVRSVLGAASYADACARSFAACGKKLSVQLYNILPKIEEADRFVTPSVQRCAFEMCPELSFCVLAGRPLHAGKKTAAGRRERLEALRPAFGDVSDLATHPPPGVARAARDDVLDALVGAWSAWRFVTGTALRLGGQLDRTGRRMEVVA